MRLRNNEGNRSNTEHGAGGDKQAPNGNSSMPDSTTKMGKPQRGKRNSRMRRNNNNKNGKTNSNGGGNTMANEQNNSAVPITAAAN